MWDWYFKGKIHIHWLYRQAMALPSLAWHGTVPLPILKKTKVGVLKNILMAWLSGFTQMDKVPCSYLMIGLITISQILTGHSNITAYCDIWTGYIDEKWFLKKPFSTQWKDTVSTKNDFPYHLSLVKIYFLICPWNRNIFRTWRKKMGLLIKVGRDYCWMKRYTSNFLCIYYQLNTGTNGFCLDSLYSPITQYFSYGKIMNTTKFNQDERTTELWMTF